MDLDLIALITIISIAWRLSFLASMYRNDVRKYSVHPYWGTEANHFDFIESL
jgi:hypothetical protein